MKEIYRYNTRLKHAYKAVTANRFYHVCSEFERAENAYTRKRYRYNAVFSLNRNDGIEKDVLEPKKSPFEIYFQKLQYGLLYAAIKNLPDTQRRRIIAFYFYGLSKVKIAQMEGVDEKAVRVAIERGEKNIKKYLEMCSDFAPNLS